jgi:transcriptional regulator with XRE-family HTH domain
LVNGVEDLDAMQAAKRSELHSLRTLNDWRRKRLSERLRALMEEKGLSVATAARLVQQQLPGGSFNSANISHYRAGRSLPRPDVLRALSAVLNVEPEELAPSKANGQAGHSNGMMELAIVDDGNHESGARDSTSNVAAPAGAANGLALGSIPEFHITDLAGGEALLQINQRLSWSTVIRILQALKGEDSNKA